MTMYSSTKGKCKIRILSWCTMTVLFQFVYSKLCDEYGSKLVLSHEQCQKKFDRCYSQSLVVRNQTNITLLINGLSFNVDTSQSSKKSTIKQFCRVIASLCLIDFDQNKNDYEKYDGMSEDDIVRSQYKLLPFPPVTEEKLKQEEKFYIENRFKMYHNSYVLDLESLNHFLYRGQNDFR